MFLSRYPWTRNVLWDVQTGFLCVIAAVTRNTPYYKRQVIKYSYMTINWNVCSLCLVIKSYKKLILHWVKCYFIQGDSRGKVNILGGCARNVKRLTCTPIRGNVLWKKHNAAWPFRVEPISDHAVLTTAVCSVLEPSWHVIWPRPLLRFDACKTKTD